MKKIFYLTALLSCFALISCSDDNDDISYPYEDHGITYIGIKSDLTSASSEQAFNSGLNEILQKYTSEHANDPVNFSFDGIMYEFSNLTEITGGIPERIWDLFWDDLEEYGYGVGSCWAFSYVQIPSKGGIGTAYVLYAIITSDVYGYGEVYYKAVRGNVTPIN